MEPAGAGLRQEASVLNGVQGMIGETAIVKKPIHGAHQPGSIRARGEDWLAIPLDASQQIEAGTCVVVADVQRGLLVVYPTED